MNVQHVNVQWDGDTCEVTCLDCGDTWKAEAGETLNDVLRTHDCAYDYNPFSTHCVWGQTTAGTPFHAALRPDATPEDFAAVQSLVDAVQAEIAAGRIVLRPKDSEKARTGPKPPRVVPLRRGRPRHDR